MSIITTSTYPGPPWYQFNGHWQTILPALQKKSTAYQRVRLELDDGDFLDVDWLRHKEKSKKLIILTHGLEGNSERPYIQSAANYFHERGWDALAWNCRSCSGEMNRLLRLYHHGETEDIGRVVDYALESHAYEKVVLAGYSMGGSMNTKYLAVNHKTLPAAVWGGIAFSSPFDLAASVDALEFWGNGIYKKRFLKQLGEKMKIKNQKFPGTVNIKQLKKVRKWRDFDRWFTAPLLGFSDVSVFYEIASAKNFVHLLNRPVLLVNALNDPIIPLACSPIEEAKTNPFLTLEMPKQGGHVGYSLPKKDYNWMDERAWAFVEGYF